LREVFPGRFKVVKPAAVELHTTMDLLCDAPTTVVLTPDTTSEQAFLPEPASLQACLLLADRGYLALHYLQRVVQQGGFFLIRAKAGLNPQVIEAFREDGKRLRSLRNKPLQAIHAKLPKRQRVELMVRWQMDGQPLCLRLIISWNRRTKSFCYLLTNLAPQRSPLDTICRAYKWRWQVELLCKEWKSYANLHAFDTTNAVIVEGLIWIAIAAAALKRFLAHMTQLLLEVPMSTRKVAMCAMYVLGDLVEALKRGDEAGLYAALEAALTYLACHAQRAHPARDRRTGRSQLGLEPFFGSDDVVEFAEAA
jgi:DDE family transposase